MSTGMARERVFWRHGNGGTELMLEVGINMAKHSIA